MEEFEKGNMETLYILGAGASKGHGVKKYPKPPTVYEFFHQRFLSKLKDKYGPLWEILNSSIDQNEAPLSSVNIEQLFSIIEPIWELSATRNLSIESDEKWEFTDLLSPLDMLRSWVVDVIHVSTGWLQTQDCPFHRKLAERVTKRNESIISFNYDLIMDVALARTKKWHMGNGYGWQSKYHMFLLVSGAEYSSSLLLKPHGSLNWFAWPPRINDNDRNMGNPADKDHRGWYLDVRPPLPTMRFFKDEIQCASPPLVAPKMTRFVAQLSDLPVEKRATLPDSLKEEGVHLAKRIEFARDLPYLVMPTPYKSLTAMRYGELKQVWQTIPKVIQSAKKVVSIGFTFCDDHFNSILIEATRPREHPLPLVIVNPNFATIGDVEKRLQHANVEIKPFNGTFEEYASEYWN